nr:CDP-glucose 4,6-dehydratase [Pseudohalocynthiibacter aestuariivivens]
MENLVLSGFWTGKRVLLTGHTGFKGSWMALWLNMLGAEVYGYALEPDTTPALFEQLTLGNKIHHRIDDVTDMAAMQAYVAEVRPDVVFHLAAQSLVLRSYVRTLETWNTNVMGTATLLEALRKVGAPCTVVVVTTDKVYHNRETHHAYVEADRLGGIDPYSASKAGTELVLGSYRSLYAQEGLPLRLASARAGNVIGGGDWCENRLVPDIARALSEGRSIETRNPGAVRPWQHVLEPLSGYMMLAERLSADETLADAFNFGPDAGDNRTVEEVIQAALKSWPGCYHANVDPSAPHEAGLLKLSIDKARSVLGWQPRWNFDAAVARTMEWYRSVDEGAAPLDVTLDQIRAYSAT